MASVTKFPYKRLKHEGGFDDEHEIERERVGVRSRTWFRVRRGHSRRRFRLKIPSLRRFLRRKVRLVTSFRVSCGNVLKRLKESQAHFGDLFAGNYLFMQINPTSMKYPEKFCKGLDLNALPPRYPLPRNIAQ